MIYILALVSTLFVATSLYLFPGHSLIALMSHSTRVLGANPQTKLFAGTTLHTLAKQLY